MADGQVKSSATKIGVALIGMRACVVVALAFSAALAAEYYLPGHTYCEVGGGCDAVRYAEATRAVSMFLPMIGLLGFTVIFATSLFRSHKALRTAAALAVVAGVCGAIFVFLQGAVIGSYCWLCVGVDSAAMAGGAFGALILAQTEDPYDGANDSSLRSLWWAPYLIAAFGPLVAATTFVDPGVPDAVVELWNPSADVNIVEMADPECPFCRELHPILKGEIDATTARGVEVHFARIMVPLSFHTHARDATAAYFCAGEQGRGEELIDVLFRSDDLSVGGIAGSAGELGLDMDAFVACRESDATEARIEADLERAEAANMEGLPTVYIGEQAIIGFREDLGAAPYREAIEATLRGEGSRTRYWPGALLALAIGLSLWMGRPRRDA